MVDGVEAACKKKTKAKDAEIEKLQTEKSEAEACTEIVARDE